MSDKLIFNCTHDKEDAERASLPNVFSLHGSIPPCSPGLKVRRWMAGDARTDTLRCQQLIDPPDGKS